MPSILAPQDLWVVPIQTASLRPQDPGGAAFSAAGRLPGCPHFLPLLFSGTSPSARDNAPPPAPTALLHGSSKCPQGKGLLAALPRPTANGLADLKLPLPSTT